MSVFCFQIYSANLGIKRRGVRLRISPLHADTARQLPRTSPAHRRRLAAR